MKIQIRILDNDAALIYKDYSDISNREEARKCLNVLRDIYYEVINEYKLKIKEGNK
jgi:hypothetical protein